LFYTKNHEWISLEDNLAIIGITQHAADELGDIVYIELPQVGDTIIEGDEIVTIESVKAASEINAPIDGTVSDINEEIMSDTSLVNENALDAWFIKVEDYGDLDTSEFMTEDEYMEYIDE
jgi:glycine cleavage system H protein